MKVNGLNKQESDLLLNYLFSLVNKRPELTCRWKWSVDDVCIWDERTTQYRRLYRCAIAERET